MAKKGITAGRVRGSAIPGVRVYYKPSLRKVVFRPNNVIRSSDYVLKINSQLEALRDKPEHPVRKCKGKPWNEFIACLKKEMKATIHKVKGAE